jgi:hypothetical protein
MSEVISLVKDYRDLIAWQKSMDNLGGYNLKKRHCEAQPKQSSSYKSPEIMGYIEIGLQRHSGSQ